MRNELENIQRAEQYLNNELSESQRQQFEKEQIENSELKSLTENVRDLQTAVFRSELRSKIEQNGGGGNGWRNTLFVGTFLMMMGAIALLYMEKPHEENKLTQLEVSNPVAQDIDNTSQVAQDSTTSIIITETPLKTMSIGEHDLWVQPDIQTFLFDSKIGATIEGEDGMLIIVPSGAFVDSKGNPISGKVEFHLVEALGIEEMVLYNLRTVSNGSPLESGGMFYMDASVDGQDAYVNPNRPLYIEIPTTDKKQGMMAFRGEINDKGDINWVDPRPLKKYLVKVPLDELDFLPQGFALEVEGNMPFLNYAHASKWVTDSLYYSLDRDGPDNSFTASEIEIATDGFLALEEDMDVSRTLVTGDSAMVSNGSPAVRDCGIDPVSIETIKKSAFDNTFIATKEFEERMKYLHQATDGNKLLQIYIDNLKNNLYQSDVLVAKSVDGEWREKFESFANEKLTNVKDAKIYQKRLSNYYRKKRKELEKSHKKLADQLASKNKEELRNILSKLSGDSRNRRLNSNSIIGLLPRPNAATSSVYAAPWYSMGWGNIDRYMKLLNKGRIEKPIAISNMSANTEVTLWLGEINTYTNLQNLNGQFLASFPSKKTNGGNSTHVFAISKSGEDYNWGIKHFNPYKVPKVELSMATASIEQIKHDLRGVGMSFGKIQKNMAWKEEQAKRMVQYRIEANRKLQAWIEKRNEIYSEYNKEVARQKAVRDVISKLQDVAFPCAESEVVSDSTTSQVFTVVEQMPQFAGGETNLLSFLQRNIRYPQLAKEQGISGTVYVSFVVNTNGVPSQARLMRGIGGGCDEEALRVVNMMPPWIPGKQRGRTVAVQYNLPVRFALK